MSAKLDRPKTIMKRSLTIAVASVLILAITGLVILLLFFIPEKSNFSAEIGKTLLNIISVGVIGTVLSLFVNSNKQKQDKFLRDQDLARIADQNKNQFRKDILRQLNKIYAGTKSTRRMLRARAFTTSYKEAILSDVATINLEMYDDAMEAINAHQLELETMRREIGTNGDLFSVSHQLEGYIKQMEDYLGKLITEYEDNRPNGLGNQPTLTIGPLRNLKGILEHSSQPTKFRDQFSEPYGHAIALIREELLKPQTETGNTSKKAYK